MDCPQYVRIMSQDNTNHVKIALHDNTNHVNIIIFRAPPKMATIEMATNRLGNTNTRRFQLTLNEVNK